MKKAVLLVSHGSRSAQARREIDELCGRLRQKTGCEIIQPAFLDVEIPRIPEGVRLCVQQGAESITVVPYFLTSGGHVLDDLPRIFNDVRKDHPGLSIRSTLIVGRHEKMADLVAELVAGKDA